MSLETSDRGTRSGAQWAVSVFIDIETVPGRGGFSCAASGMDDVYARDLAQNIVDLKRVSRQRAAKYSINIQNFAILKNQTLEEFLMIRPRYT